MKNPIKTLLPLLLISTANLPADAPASHDTPFAITRDGAFKHRPQWHPDGQKLAFARHEASGNSIFIRIAKTSDLAHPERLTKRIAPEYHATFSPDGKAVLLTLITLSGTQGNLDIALMPSDGSAEPKIVAGDHDGKLSHQDWPAWMPDGKRFVFTSTHEGNQELYLAHIDHSKPIERLTQSPGQDLHPAVSPDGTFILFSTDRWSGLELARLDLADRKITRLTTSPGLDDYPSIAPDQKKWVFISARSGTQNVWISNSNGQTENLTQSTTPNSFPTFTPDGKHVTYISNKDGKTDIYTIAIPKTWLK